MASRRSISTKRTVQTPAACHLAIRHWRWRQHLFYLYPPDVTIKNNNRGKWLKGVDVKSDGGYVILPEAEHYSGGRYKWINWLDPLVPLPPDVAQDMSQAKTGDYTSAGGFDISGVLSGLPQGERNNTIFRFCCWLRRQYRDDWDFVVGNAIMANARCIPPLDEAELRQCVDSAFKLPGSSGARSRRPSAIDRTWT